MNVCMSTLDKTMAFNLSCITAIMAVTFLFNADTCYALPAAKPIAPGSKNYEVLKAEFGLFVPENPQSGTFTPSDHVPNVTDQSYGWIITLRTTSARIRWREEFTLPEVPATWGNPESDVTRMVSPDGKTLVTENVVAPDQNPATGHAFINNAWSVESSDPVGRYRIRVYIEGELVATFNFNVE